MWRKGCIALGICLTSSIGTSALLVSSGNNTVLQYDAGTGAFIDAFVSAGSGGLSDPRGLALGPAGDLFVSSFATNSVLEYNGTTGTFERVFVTPGSGGLSGPFDLSFGSNGNLFVDSSVSDQVLQYDGSTGAFINSFATGAVPALNTPRGMVFGSGNLFVSGEGDRIWRFDASTGTFQSSTFGDNPRGLAIGPDGNLYASFRVANLVERYSGSTGAPIGEFVTNAGNGGLLNPLGLNFGPDGNLYVVGSGNNGVLRYNGATGTFIDNFVAGGSGGLANPQFLLFAPQQVPEPGAFGCLASGLIFLGAVRLCLLRRADARTVV
jgi:WD40 repeat protein